MSGERRDTTLSEEEVLEDMFLAVEAPAIVPRAERMVDSPSNTGGEDTERPAKAVKTKISPAAYLKRKAEKLEEGEVGEERVVPCPFPRASSPEGGSSAHASAFSSDGEGSCSQNESPVDDWEITKDAPYGVSSKQHPRAGEVFDMGWGLRGVVRTWDDYVSNRGVEKERARSYSDFIRFVPICIRNSDSPEDFIRSGKQWMRERPKPAREPAAAWNDWLAFARHVAKELKGVIPDYAVTSVPRGSIVSHPAHPLGSSMRAPTSSLTRGSLAISRGNDARGYGDYRAGEPVARLGSGYSPAGLSRVMAPGGNQSGQSTSASISRAEFGRWCADAEARSAYQSDLIAVIQETQLEHRARLDDCRKEVCSLQQQHKLRDLVETKLRSEVLELKRGLKESVAKRRALEEKVCRYHSQRPNPLPQTPGGSV